MTLHLRRCSCLETVPSVGIDNYTSHIDSDSFMSCIFSMARLSMLVGCQRLTPVRPVSTDEERLTAARSRYSAVLEASGGEERLVSGSDDFTMFLWSPARGNKPIGGSVPVLCLSGQLQKGSQL